MDKNCRLAATGRKNLHASEWGKLISAFGWNAVNFHSCRGIPPFSFRHCLGEIPYTFLNALEKCNWFG